MSKIYFFVLLTIQLYLVSPVNSQGNPYYDLNFTFIKNNVPLNTIGSNNYVVFPNDNCKIKISGIFRKTDKVQLITLEERDLLNPVVFGQYLPKELDTIYMYRDFEFNLTGLKPDKYYRYDIILITQIDTSKKLSIFEFNVEVHTRTHIEAGIGPVFSNLSYNEYVLNPMQGDTSGSITINNIGTKQQLLFVMGAIIRPWGYDQRATPGIENLFFYIGLGINNKQKVTDNLHFGIGYGFKGFNLVAGIHLSPEKHLLDGYKEGVKYGKNDIGKIENILTEKLMANFFGGILIDLSIFDKTFPKIF